MKRILFNSFLLFSIFIISDCSYLYRKKCPDIHANKVNNEEIYFLTNYEIGDKIKFININNDKESFLTCNKRDFNLRKINWHDDVNCKNEGYVYINDELKISFLSKGLPYGLNDLERIDIELLTTVDANSLFNIFFKGENESRILKLKFNPYDSALELYAKPAEFGISLQFFKSKIFNDVTYKNVYQITDHWGYYNTIYYNGEFGILKLVSDEGNLEIEIVQ